MECGDVECVEMYVECEMWEEIGNLEKAGICFESWKNIKCVFL